MAREIRTHHDGSFPDYCCLSCGTGGTLAGFLTGTRPNEKVLGFSALKGDFLAKEIERLLAVHTSGRFSNWQLITDYHFGGYARFRPALIHFIKNFQENHNIPLDPIYTGKLMYGVVDLAEKGFFPNGSTVMVIHTGGLQGIAGFNERYGLLVD